MTATPLEAPREHRPGSGWIAFFLIVLLMMVGSLAMYFSPEATTTDREDRVREIQRIGSTIRQAVKQGELTRRTGREPEYDFAAQIRRLDELKDEHVTAAKLLVATKVETGQEPELEDLAALGPLEESPEARDRAFLAVYRTAELSPERAQELAGQLPDNPFIYRMAKIHALERAEVERARDGMLTRGEFITLSFLGMALTIFGMLGLGVWLIYLIARSNGLLKPLGHPSENLTPPNADRYAMRAAQVLIVLIGVGVVAGLAGAGQTEGLIGIAVTLLLIGAVLMLAKLPVFGKYISPRMQGLHADNLGKNIFWGICGFFANIPIAAITLILSMSLMQHLPEPTHPVAEQMAAGVTWTEFFVILMAASVAAPIIEEICFRGTLLPAMASALRSVPWAIILSSLIFAAIHPQGIVMWLPLAGVGAIAAMLTYQTRSLIPAIVLHALHNGVILSAAMLVSQAL